MTFKSSISLFGQMRRDDRFAAIQKPGIRHAIKHILEGERKFSCQH
jgi:hypothetical protein